jgi:hypothetical protein
MSSIWNKQTRSATSSPLKIRALFRREDAIMSRRIRLLEEQEKRFAERYLDVERDARRWREMWIRAQREGSDTRVFIKVDGCYIEVIRDRHYTVDSSISPHGIAGALQSAGVSV